MITIKELETFITSLDKNPGEYTLDELYHIGALHKKLSKEYRSWEDLAKKVGYTKKADSYRRFVAKREQRLDEICDYTVNITERSGHSIEDDLIMSDEHDPKMPKASEYEKLYKTKTEIRDIYNTYRAGLRNEARLDNFKNLLVTNIKDLKNLPEVKYNGKFDDDAEAILMLGDLHMGIDCNNFYNVFNSDVAKKRLQKLSLDTIRYCKKFNIKQLNVLGLGDFIQGIIHVNGRINAQMNVVQQVIMASEYISDFLNSINGAAPIVTYRSCTDNHSRVSPNKTESIENENLSKLIDFYIETRLNGSPIKFMKDNLDDSLGSFRLMNGKNVVYAHGHLDSINKCFENFVGATRQFVDYMILGHYHCEKAKSFQGARVFVNGSICGTEEYALSRRLFSDPSQTLLIFNNDNLINVSINLKNT